LACIAPASMARSRVLRGSWSARKPGDRLVGGLARRDKYNPPMVEDGATRNRLTTHAARNQAAWDASSDEYQERHGAFLAASGGLTWGTRARPRERLGR
jgi:hypothetical protein